MLVNRVPALSRLLSITPHKLEIVLAEDGRARLMLLLPPLEELTAIKNLSPQNVSLFESAANTGIRLSADFDEELKRLLQKRERFQKSPTYWAHLANLAELARDQKAEYAFLEDAEKVSDSNFFRHRRAVNLATQGEPKKAEDLFKTLDLDTDVGANLRLAYLYVRRQQLERAWEFVERAVDIDRIDFGARMFQGALWLAQGEPRRAIHSFRIAAEERETSALFTNMAIAHIRLRQPDKAIGALKRAIRLEPFNENAVATLADLTFAEKRNREAINSLDRYLEFEQKKPSMWARLARALLESGNKQRALDALKRQASIEESAAVFNNIGVTYSQLGNKERAAQYFAYALQKAKSEKQFSYKLAARNLLSALAETEKFIDVVAVGKEVLKADTDFEAARHRTLSDIYTLFIYGVARSGKQREAEQLARRLLMEIPEAHPRLRMWLTSCLIGNLALQRDKWQDAERFVEQGLQMLKDVDPDDTRRDILLNNIAFLYLETGKKQEASRLLSLISKWIHKEAYPTATLGLLQMRRGRIKKGEVLYREAIKLARTAHDKDLIAQKMHFELGKLMMDVNPRLARQHLTKAARDFPKTEQITAEARKLLAALPVVSH
jgi:tetratricopeptide (TPR) repeat protein